MDSLSEKGFYDKVSENIRKNLCEINNLLQNCEIDSKIGNCDTETKIISFLMLDVAKLQKDEAKSDYYDLEEVSKVFEMLEPPKVEGKRRLKLTKSGSLVSLTPRSCQSIEDISQQQDNVNEISVHLKKIRILLESISNTSIESTNLNAVKDKQTGKNTSFVDMVMSLQKLAKELHNITLADPASAVDEDLKIGSQIVKDTNSIRQTLANIHRSNRNPITNCSRQENTLCSKPLTIAVNEILDAVEKNPL